MKRVMYGLAGFLATGLLIGLILYFNPGIIQRLLLKPSAAFDAASAPPAPDYADPEAWAALPDRADPADTVPPDTAARDNQATAQVDVFFVHPTTYYSDEKWNARYDEPGETRRFLEQGVLRYQASAFNGAGRVYAPRYRQATLYSFMGTGPDEDAALGFAYEDVSRAFDYFIRNFNDGRPFILAAHSQGSLHGMRLLQERIAGTPLADRLVAAYLVGYSIPADMGLGSIGPCRGAKQTGCYLNWNSVTAGAGTDGWLQNGKVWLEGRLQPIAGRALACVNPLVGMQDAAAEASSNEGTLPFVEAGNAFPAPLPSFTGARCDDNGLLYVTIPDDADGFTYGVMRGDYHVYDYNLFYMNIRRDAEVRAAAYLMDHPQ